MASHKQLRLMRLPIGGLVLASLTLAASCLLSSSEAATQKPTVDDLNIPKIDLLLSGGGLRASAFAYGVLAGLNDICVSAKETEFAHREKDDQGELKNCAKGTPLLDQVNIISAVSGGAVTAAYFKTHREEFFEEFPKLLKKSNLQWRLLKAEKSPSWKRILRSPVFLLTSIWDTIGSVIGLPLSLLNLNIELTPIAVMALSDGLLESEQLTTVYKDVFYQNLRLEDLSEKNGFPVGALVRTGEARSSPTSPTLLINATDITNGTVFTFDERTFECMGARSERGNVELALAVAASSSLPGVFSPVRIDSVLKSADPLSIPADCPPTLADRSRKPVLVDGGVTDNLGAIGLLRTVMRKKEELVGNGLSHDARKEKHLLLFVNSEAESDAKLPGLAGYFDASHDVLIRSKKDLVRVMVSELFQHFGFSTVELRMSDLVSSAPVLKNLVGANLVPRAMDLTEKEQKIERNLDQIGMLPSSDEIDTLISMGKKIVSNRFEALGESYSSLREMEFMDNCAAIANPDKYWCWPDQFRSNDLESGGGSAFLKTLDDVTSKFRTNAIQAREALFQEILLESAEIARQELRAFAGEKPEEKNKALLNFLIELIKKPLQETELYNILVEAKISPEASADCIQAFHDMKSQLQSAVQKWDKLSFDQTLIKLSDTLHAFPKATCFPEYHMIRFFPKILNLSSEKELNKNDLVQLTGLLQQGLNGLLNFFVDGESQS